MHDNRPADDAALSPDDLPSDEPELSELDKTLADSFPASDPPPGP